MSLFKIFDVAGSAMSAETIRLNVTSSNLANANSVSSSTGNVYRARHPVFAAVMDAERFDSDEVVGVRVDAIVESQAPSPREYWPEHPKADADGYIFRPNVNVVEELANMISASRSFQTNVEVMNTSKQMLLRVLDLGR